MKKKKKQKNEESCKKRKPQTVGEQESDVRGPVELKFLLKIETQHLVHHYSCKTVMHHEHFSLRCLDVLLTANAKLYLPKSEAKKKKEMLAK